MSVREGKDTGIVSVSSFANFIECPRAIVRYAKARCSKALDRYSSNIFQYYFPAMDILLKSLGANLICKNMCVAIACISSAGAGAYRQSSQARRKWRVHSAHSTGPRFCPYFVRPGIQESPNAHSRAWQEYPEYETNLRHLWSARLQEGPDSLFQRLLILL